MMAKKRNKFINLTLVCSLTAVAVVGCKKDQAVPAPQKPAPGAQTASAVQPKPAVQTAASSAKKALPLQSQSSTAKKKATTVTLDFSNRKDPFKPAIFEMEKVPKGSSKDVALNSNLIPIQRYDVEKFKITGIIAGLKENRALLIDPEGKAYVAKTGMMIGPNKGKITRITANTVEVDESFKDDSGRIRKRTVKLALQRKK